MKTRFCISSYTSTIALLTSILAGYVAMAKNYITGGIIAVMLHEQNLKTRNKNEGLIRVSVEQLFSVNVNIMLLL